MTIFATFMVLMILTVGGIGVDLMRSERDRTILQNTLDRAVLAAADLDQESAPETVVNDYFEAAGLKQFLSNVHVEQTLRSKTIGAKAQSITSTAFMKMAGVDTLNATAIGVAAESAPLVEISMVLDISGSMKNDGRIEKLRDAASDFVDTVLKDGNEDTVSVSLIPYSEQVNVSPALFNLIKKNRYHNFSHCLEFDAADFSVPYLDTLKRYHQTQHYQFNYSAQNLLTDTICPRWSYEAIKPITNDADALKAQIAQLQPRAGTQIFVGMKWATALLDPKFRHYSRYLSNGGHIPAEFSNRPLDYYEDDVLKTIVLMTDGKNSRSYRIQDWAYDSTSDYAHWSRYNLWYYLLKHVPGRDRYRYYTQKYNEEQGDSYTRSICQTAKSQGIVVWTIGFEVDDHGASVMQECASSPSHFFRVAGLEINEAFDAVANQINQLRLTQ